MNGIIIMVNQRMCLCLLIVCKSCRRQIMLCDERSSSWVKLKSNWKSRPRKSTCSTTTIHPSIHPQKQSQRALPNGLRPSGVNVCVCVCVYSCECNGKLKWRSVDFFNKTLKKLTFFSGATQMENSNGKLKWKIILPNVNGKVLNKKGLVNEWMNEWM